MRLPPMRCRRWGGRPVGSTSQATSMLNTLNYQATVKNFVAAVQYLKTHPLTTGKVGCTGFCWGGAMTNQVAVNAPDLAAAVPFYGAQPVAADVPKIKASLLCHYGALDTNINAGIVAFEAALKAAGIDYGIYIHKGAGHAFFNDTKTAYNKAAADLAWRLTLAFFQAKLKDDSLAAHYRLDETEGRTAKDSVGGNDGTAARRARSGSRTAAKSGGRAIGWARRLPQHRLCPGPGGGAVQCLCLGQGRGTGTGDCLTGRRCELARDGRRREDS